MADKVTRERALLDDELVTVLSRKGRKAEVRTAFGYVKEVPAKYLKALPDGDERKEYEVVTD